jgi:hypothetical protein
MSPPAATAATTPTAADTFDQRNEITRNPDGTVGTKRSPVLGNARQPPGLTNMRDNARDLIAGAGQALTAAEEARVRNAQSQRARDIDSTSDVPTMLPAAANATGSRSAMPIGRPSAPGADDARRRVASVVPGVAQVHTVVIAGHQQPRCRVDFQ